MRNINILKMTALFICLAVTCSCSQKNPGNPLLSTDVFVGSTPCDSFIHSLLQIPAGEICEFIKWELNLPVSPAGKFQLTALYGESQPNTNGFKGGGTKIELSGKYTLDAAGINSSPNTLVYYLNSNQLQKPFLLIKMDKNVFHFADANKKFLIGNGGWGYVLNRLK